MKLKLVRNILIVAVVVLVTCILFSRTTPVLAKEDYYYNIEWLENNRFDNSSLWILDTSGDNRDVANQIVGGEATFTLIGDEGGYEFNANPPLSDNWTQAPNPEFIIPDVYGIDENGCYIGHEYWEGTSNNYFGVQGNQTRNFPSMTWVHSVQLPINMSDFIITSASVYALVNGSGDTNLETPGDELNDFNPPTVGYLGVGDYARFYVIIADPNDIENYQIAYNKTTTLGRDFEGSVAHDQYGDIVYLNDTTLIPVDEDLLILYLTKVLQYDYTNFSIILGIDAYCEDNYNEYDRDTFYDLRIKEFSLNFTYEKKIDQFSTASYSQTGDIVNCTTITNASMSFDYNIDSSWTSASPNSEIQAIINGRIYSETVKLNTFTTSPQTVEFSGIGLKDLLTPNLSVTVLIQLYIADEFELTDNYTLYIDNVFFKISYMVFTPDPISEPPPNYLALTLGLGGVMGVLSIVFGLYQGIFKFPVHVRKIRKIRRKIRRGVRTKPLNVNSRTEQVDLLNKMSLNLEDFILKPAPKTL